MSFPWPAVNARLLDLRAPGAADDYGDVNTANATTLFTGSLECVLMRVKATAISGASVIIGQHAGTVTPVDRDFLIVRQPPKVITDAKWGDESTGYTVLVRDQRDGTDVDVRFRVIGTTHRGRGEARSVRFELEDPRT